MKKTITAFLFLVLAAQTVFCQSGNFPMEKYQRAVEKRDFATITEIIKKYGTNSEYSNESILIEAVEYNDVELARVLLEAGIPTSLDSGYGYDSPFSRPIMNNNLEMVKVLVEHYTIVPRDVSNTIQFGNIDALNLFAGKGVDLRGIQTDGTFSWTSSFTYFNNAVIYGRLELAKRFLREGHSINMIDILFLFDYTQDPRPTIHSALDYATASGNQELTSWLLSNGAKSGYEILNGMSMYEIEERFSFSLKDRPSYRTVTDDLRYRAEPTLTGAVLGLLNTRDVLYAVCRSKEKMDIDSMSDYWLYVISDNGKRGWAYGGYLKPDQD